MLLLSGVGFKPLSDDNIVESDESPPPKTPQKAIRMDKIDDLGGMHSDSIVVRLVTVRKRGYQCIIA